MSEWPRKTSAKNFRISKSVKNVPIIEKGAHPIRNPRSTSVRKKRGWEGTIREKPLLLFPRPGDAWTVW